MNRRYDAVLFDLLTALLDSWSLWNAVAGNAESGRRWRTEYLRITYAAGRYLPYEQLVGDAAQAIGLPRRLADELAARYSDIEPWPEAGGVLGELHDAGVALGVVTNCSETLGRLAASRVPVPFRVVVTAERAGHYKPDPIPYRLALGELGVDAERCLFVAGSAYDLFGTARVGMPTWWHDRIGMTPPPDAPAPLAHHRTLTPLVAHVLA
ncbi:MAG TPA: HAD-IA family hydrolase [Acetobacteraceae bacterium]|jgi:2-haloacid dehalogenase|nr:HAD-IA family hydrolase [Acetobacteraceae bacterium]